MPRRSRRISENPAQLTYTPKKTRQKRDLNDVSSPTAVNSPAKVAAITQALQAETVAANPLNTDTISEVERYCGTHMINEMIPSKAADSTTAIRDALANDFNMDDESILKSLEYDPGEDAFTSEDEEPEEEPEEVPEEGDDPEEEPLDYSE